MKAGEATSLRQGRGPAPPPGPAPAWLRPPPGHSGHPWPMHQGGRKRLTVRLWGLGSEARIGRFRLGRPT